MSTLVTPVDDLRGGSHEDGQCFTQMLEQELAEALETEEPPPKRQEALGSTDLPDMNEDDTVHAN